MLKDIVEYTDIEGRRQTQTVFFNLTQFEVEGEMELEVIQERFQRFMDEVIGDDDNPKRDLTGPEKRELLNMVKVLIRASYGLKEGIHFRKTEKIWDDFKDSGAFSAFLYQLFLQEGAANRFMEGIWPQGVDRATPDGSVLKAVPDIPESNGRDSMNLTVDPATDTDEKQWFDYTEDELLALDDGDFNAVIESARQGKNIPPMLLVIKQRRKSFNADGPTEE